MKKHKVLLVIGCFIIAVIGGLGFWMLLSGHHENVSKQLLTQEVGNLPHADGCTEKYRAYQRGGVDTNSSWHVVYTCQGEQETVKDAIVKGLQSQGYAEITGGQTVSHFKNDSFQVDYDFIPDSASSTTISLNIYRAGRSY